MKIKWWSLYNSWLSNSAVLPFSTVTLKFGTKVAVELSFPHRWIVLNKHVGIVHWPQTHVGIMVLISRCRADQQYCDVLLLHQSFILMIWASMVPSMVANCHHRWIAVDNSGKSSEFDSYVRVVHQIQLLFQLNIKIVWKVWKNEINMKDSDQN